MRRPDRVDRFLDDVDRALPLDAATRGRVVAELRAHLDDAVAAEIHDGAHPDDAARVALQRVGDARTIASQYATRHPLLDGLSALGALVCLGVGGWLLIVAATVVPQQDPSAVGFWDVVAVGFIGLAVASGAYLIFRQRHRVAPAVMSAIALMAIVAGARFAIPMLTTSGDFEGYILMFGLILIGQGSVILADIAAVSRLRRRLR